MALHASHYCHLLYDMKLLPDRQNFRLGRPAEIICTALCMQVDLVQASNLSWFGYPDDTLPSARNFLPGLSKVISPCHAPLFLNSSTMAWAQMPVIVHVYRSL